MSFLTHYCTCSNSANAISDAGAEALAEVICTDSVEEGESTSEMTVASSSYSGAGRLESLDLAQVSRFSHVIAKMVVS